eukprot:CAMPEP_0172302744 /NCGR_PEP_ID=MMETSP1058-20130122/4404_1 /TAXON_ID=83371 /ORGANISM="Detonula confervacea, Strain CCMP 353" /LENGTH=443 /DNA_ID=CAMNT_0013013337 /DNA_START=45 /DNA_END=1376 /DNA_ORIENTATION=+
MSNAQDLLSILGGASAASRPPVRATSTSGNTETTILTFKAGKMNTTLKPNGKYLVEPDSRRGELHVVWTATALATGHLKLEWKDRRTKTTVNTISVFPADDATFERVETGRDGDRVYLLQCGDNADARHFFWMQDKDTEPDEDICVKVNLYMSDCAEAASAAGATSDASSAATTDATAAGTNNNAMDNAELLRIMQGALGSQSLHDAEGARTTTVPGSDSIPTANAGQVDALGNILENLGMPLPNGTPAGERNAGTAGAAAGAGGLTLADLQGAMAGLATASPPATVASAASAGPPLSELASSDIINESGILDDPATIERLVALLPEGQRTEANLRDTIRSPQVAQSLQRLTSALADDAGSFNSIIANFQLNPADGAGAMMGSGNPIEAFLNCLLKDVERKEGVKKNDDVEGGDEGESKKEDGSSGGGEEGKDGGGDVKMDES